MKRHVNRIPHGGMPEFQSAPSTGWLEENRRFSYFDGTFRVTMQKEERRGKCRYWYGYAKFGGRTVSVYAGTNETLHSKLTSLPDRLTDIARKKGLL